MDATGRATKPRAEFVDALKGIVIVLVVVCHESAGIRKAGIPVPEAFALISRYSYSFFMPLMFLLSGLFIESAVRRGPKNYTAARFKTLVYPFVLWSLITGPIMLMASKVVNHSVSRNPLMWLTLHPLGPLWFLEALILCQFAYGLLRYLKLDQRVIAALFLVCTAIGAFLPDDIGPQTLFSLGFFGMGAALSGWVLELPRRNLVLLLAGGLGIEAAHLALVASTPTPAVIFAAAWIGCAAYLGVGAAVGHLKPLAFLRSLGAASIAIYVMHTMVGGCLRILLHKFAGITNPALHLTLAIGTGLLVPWALYTTLDRRFPYLFRWPTPRPTSTPTPTAAVAEPLPAEPVTATKV